MKKLYFLFFITIAQWQAMGQTGYWQQQVDYAIDVSLNDHEHTLDGFLKLRYVNHSPDTLRFIWFHLWPNAFKNDRTAFTEQTLQNGNTGFYFADREKRGYINRLDFRVNNNTVKTEDHPQYIDVIKVYLPTPLAPHQETVITTPFHVKLPANFSRGGHTAHSYQVTQWYPKPAVYDRTGWHPMPYLELGEFYSEFGSFDVRITVPEGYVVAATGELQNEEERKWLEERALAGSQKPEAGGRKSAVRSKKPVAKKPAPVHKKKPVQKKAGPKGKQPANDEPPGEPVFAAKPTKTLRYIQNKVHDFAWFADSAYKVLHDTIQLASGRVVQAYSFYRAKKDSAWEKSMGYIKDAVHFRSNLIGEYPFNTVSVVEAKMGFDGGMEYPTITSISPGMSEKQLDVTIEHEIGHNWFYGILATNERDYPWMDEGINTYYDNRYKALKYSRPDYPNWLQKKLPGQPDALVIDALAKMKKDQPVTLPAAAYTDVNYGVMVYLKTGILMQHLEATVGIDRFDSSMQAYYRQWQFKHPYPDDFKQSMQAGTSVNLQPFFDSLQQTGPVTNLNRHKTLKPAFLFSFKDYDRYSYVYWLPVAGYNMYDHFMMGAMFHNYTLPAHKLQFMAAPLYAIGSKQVNGVAHVSYTIRPGGWFDKIEPAVGFARFNTNSNVDTSNNKIFENYYRLAPSLRFYFKRALQSHVTRWLDVKTFIIGEQQYSKYAVGSDGNFHPVATTTDTRYLNQVSLVEQNNRALYPYDYQLQVQQAKNFYRINVTGNYYLNYAHGGGMQVRLFAAKFGYIGTRNYFETYRYQPKLMAEQGSDDYTYSNYFVGRSENTGWASQQVMIRDGGLKLRTEMFSVPATRSENWVAAMNGNTSLPKGLFPVELPLRVFLDVGTYAESWKKDAATSRFLYVAGLQLALFKDLLNVYAPILYSKEFRNNLKTLPEENKFFKKISFSLDIHRFNLRRETKDKIPF